MRFWQKTLLVVLILFILTLDVSVIMIMKKVGILTWKERFKGLLVSRH